MRVPALVLSLGLMVGCEPEEPALEILGLRACPGGDLSDAMTLDASMLDSSVVHYAWADVPEATITPLSFGWRLETSAISDDPSRLLGADLGGPASFGDHDLVVSPPSELRTQIEAFLAEGGASVTVHVSAVVTGIARDGSMLQSPAFSHVLTFCRDCAPRACNDTDSTR